MLARARQEVYKSHMPIRQKPGLSTPFGELSLSKLNIIARDLYEGTPLYTGSVVLLDMLDTCNIPGFYPVDTNIFGRKIDANIMRHTAAHELINAISGPNPHEGAVTPKTLADAYINTAYRVATGLRVQINSRQIAVDGVVYYIHCAKGRHIGMFNRQEDQPPTNRDERVVRISRRGLFPQVAKEAVEAAIKSKDTEESREIIACYGQKLQQFGRHALDLCKVD